MERLNIKVNVNRLSFFPGETIELKISLNQPTNKISNLIHIQADCFRADVERNVLVSGAGREYPYSGGGYKLNITVPDGAKPGLYILRAYFNKTPAEPPLFFTVTSKSDERASNGAIDSIVREIEKQRMEYENRKFITENAKCNYASSSQFRVFIFGVGCLLHHDQQLEGRRIVPLKRGFSNHHMQEIVEYVLGEALDGIKILNGVDMKRKHESGTPTFFIEYPNVISTGVDDAEAYCYRDAELLFQILGIARGQKPRAFAYASFEHESGEGYLSYENPRYRGNLLSDFDPSIPARWVEAVYPKIAADPFARLIVKTYTDATSEMDYGFALLRYWSVLELIADKRISERKGLLYDPNGKKISKANGNHVQMNAKEARVYRYIIDNGGMSSNGTLIENGKTIKFIVSDDRPSNEISPDDLHLTVWDLVTSAYVIRNAVAHEGQFDPEKAAKDGNEAEKLAARLYKLEKLQDFIGTQAEAVIQREVAGFGWAVCAANGNRGTDHD